MQWTTRLVDGLFAVFVILGVCTFSGAIGADAPTTILFETKMGNVTYDHTAHVGRAGGTCETCHTKLFPQSREPINYKAAMHKQAEAKKTSCAGCHVDGGAAFASKGRCADCHKK